MEDEFSDFEELICSLFFLVASNQQNNVTIGFVIHENLWKEVLLDISNLMVPN